MSQNSNAIISLCSHLCVGEGITPLEPKEWSELAKNLLDRGFAPENLFDFSKDDIIKKLNLTDEYAERIVKLIERTPSLSFELGEYENMGITVVTRADSIYPSKLKKVLGNNCPPLFYYAGDMSLLNKQYVGYVGSRTISDDDIEFTKSIVAKTVGRGYGIVSGGAKGIDTVAEEEGLKLGASVVEYLSDSMMKKMNKSAIIKAVREGRMLILSVTKPDAPFNVGVAMMRNRYIYAQSSGTIVIRSEYNKGGTWSGAVENLKYGWCKEFCRDKKSYPGNMALVEKGAIPIDDSWDGDINSINSGELYEDNVQLSMFDE